MICRVSRSQCLFAVVLCGMILPRSSASVIAQSDDTSPRVRTVAAIQQQVSRTVTQPASIEPWYRAEIRARVQGYVTDVSADIGDVVQQGQTLAILAAPELQKQAEITRARIRRMQAEEQRAKANKDVTVANIEAAEANYKQTQSQVAMDDALFKAATAEFERFRDLVSRGATEPRMLDEATRRKESAAASRQASLSAITSAQASVLVARARQAAAEAEITVAQTETQIAQSELEELEIMINYLTIKAPFEGVVTHRSLNPGDLVAAGNGSDSAEPLFVVSQLQKVRCLVDIPERDAAFVRRGDVLTVRFPSFPTENVETTIARTSQNLNRETRTMRIEADIPNPEGKLLPGMFGQATLTMNISETASLLPARSVRFDAKGNAFVYAIQPDQTVAITNVQILSDDGRMLQIAGLEKNQRVVDAHLQRFTDGQKVEILPE